MSKTFRGGICRPSAPPRPGGPIRTAEPPARAILPLSQHVGTPAKPVVVVGDVVRVGTKIAEAEGFVSAPVHASISGRVRAIADFPHPAGCLMPAIEIEGDGKDEAAACSTRLDLSSAEPAAVRNAIWEAGIVGLGGAGFPTHVKLSPPAAIKIDTVILNGAECEPSLAGDRRMMVEHAETIVEGLLVMMRAVGARWGYIGIERNKRDAIRRMREASAGEGALRVVELATKYPQGAEKMLIKVITGREVPREGLPMDVGSVVQNVSTSAAVAEAVKYGKPLLSRVVTVAGSAARSPGVFRVRLGTPVRDLIGLAGGARDDCARIVIGGPMTGVAQLTADVPVIKTTIGVILLREKDVPTDQAGPCIRCGRCVERCPMRLMPNDLARFAERARLDEATSYGILDCIECGVCAYVCPAKIDLVRWMRLGKAAVTAAGQAGKA
ncbi:MAG TPA: electron transport complex subunit RsxC [bacterium]|nr:electron transport complex subunit RsxC [bacterium]